MIMLVHRKHKNTQKHLWQLHMLIVTPTVLAKKGGAKAVATRIAYLTKRLKHIQTSVAVSDNNTYLPETKQIMPPTVTDSNAYLPKEKVADFDGAPGAFSGSEDHVSAARTQKRIHVRDRAGRRQVTCRGRTHNVIICVAVGILGQRIRGRFYCP